MAAHVPLLLVERLTPREKEVLDLLAQGMSNAEIGVVLVIENATTRNHLHNIFEKWNVTSRTQALLVGQSMGLIGIPAQLSPLAQAVASLLQLQPGILEELAEAGLLSD